MTDSGTIALDVALVHVGIARSLVQRNEPGEPPPEWALKAGKEKNANLSLRGRDSEHFIAQVDVEVAKNDIYSTVTVHGLYRIHQDGKALRGANGNPLLVLAPAVHKQLAASAMDDLYPFARAIVHEATSKVASTDGILLAPQQFELR
ncbi:hypothetical protein [Rhodococcus sp. BH5]|uniref:hypothetical protein n=1 Tax=Rhodococcus sp. BH5 TaxID=2871702 RepID=UPI0022CD80D0|nr:hypothetical protein [Rhodococcus sp. BH5]MCZ9634598.1 hypothetical protein [Rhodococcus sp. BH5]